jgi:hypothetical protein
MSDGPTEPSSREPKPAEPKSAGKRSHPWRWVLGILLILIIITLAGFWHATSSGRRYLAEQVAAEQVRWRARWPEVPDESNRLCAYEDLEAAVESANLPQEELQLRWLSPAPDIGSPWPADDAKVRAKIAAGKKYVDALAAAARLPGFGRPHEFVRVDKDPMGPFPHLLRWRYVTRLAGMQAWVDLRQGRRKRATETLGSLFQASVDMGKGGSLIHHMIGLAFTYDGLAPLYYEINRPGWTAAELRALAARLQRAHDELPPLANVLRNERIGLLLHLESVCQGKMEKQEGPVIFSLVLMGVENCDDWYLRLIEACRLPYGEWQRESARIEGEIKDIMDSIGRYNPANILLLLAMPNLSEALKNHIEGVARLRVAIAALRLQAAYLEKGGYPSSMEDLARSDGLPVIADPFDEKPLRLKHNEDGSVTVYTIGPDLKDDGGHHKRTEENKQQIPKWVDLTPKKKRKSQEARHKEKKLASPPPVRPGDDFSFTVRPLKTPSK